MFRPSAKPCPPVTSSAPIEAVKTVSDAFIPVGAEVLEFNPAVDVDPSIVNRDPYGEGWLVKVKLTDPKECESLLTDAQYKELIG